MHKEQAISNRYKIVDRLGAGGMGIVYRAMDRLSGNLVALKRVAVPAQQLMFSSRGSDDTELDIALAQEFRMLSSLRHPNIVSVLDYGFHEGQYPYFAMTLLENAESIVDRARNAPIEQKVDLIIQVLQALTYLHRRAVIHRDIKPSNVLVADGQVKVVDFGLSRLRERSTADLTGTTVGTVTYMAPELFEGKSATKSSDLYAVGLLAYEIFAGKYPFERSSFATLLNQILNKSPDMTALGVDIEIAKVLEKLLAKRIQVRYQDADIVIKDLCKAAGLSIPAETALIRESFLQAAKFVGRETELDELSHLLSNLVQGNGSAWLVGGESGVGKTRLLDELSTLALVQGVILLRGQAISEGDRPYQLWRDIVRHLALYVDLDDRDAGVLKALVPDIGTFLGRDILDAPPKDPQETQLRLFKAIEMGLRHVRRPILIVLDDLQWAGSESLALLNRLTRLTAEVPLLVLGAYRNDEYPDLPDEIVNIHLMPLERLAPQDIAELSRSMLGDASKQPSVLQLLQRETEGNAFFLVEVVRALAEEAGELGKIGEVDLPQSVSVEGIQAIIERRLNKVPATAKPLLKLAAIGGRRLDLDLLNHLAAQDVDAWLRTCADAAILSIQNEQWQFSHDKLREAVLDELKGEEHSTLYGQVAGAFEVVYPQADARAAMLAHLWGVAGDEEKELHYTTLAARQAFQTCANAKVVDYLPRAIELLLKLRSETTERDGQEMELQIMLGLATSTVQGYASPLVYEALLQARHLARQLGAMPPLVAITLGLFIFTWNQTKMSKAQEYADELLCLAQEEPGDASHFFLGAYLALGATKMILGELKQARHYLEQMVALHDPEKHRSLTPQLYAQDPLVAGSTWLMKVLHWLGYPERALKIGEQSLAWAEQLDHKFSLAFSQLGKSWLHHWRRDVGLAQENAEKVLAISEHGYPILDLTARIIQGWVDGRQGDFERCIADVQECMDNYIAVGSTTFQTWYLLLIAEAHMDAGQLDLGLATVNQALDIAEKGEERLYRAELYRLKGELLEKQWNVAEAEASFQRAVEIARRQEAKLFELRATVSLARHWQWQGKIDQAHKTLSGIYNWFTEGFDTVDLQEAKSLLDALS